jgi:hypothetical protein
MERSRAGPTARSPTRSRPAVGPPPDSAMASGTARMSAATSARLPR